MAFDHRAYMAAKGNKPASKLKLKDGTTYRVAGYAPVYTVDVLTDLARAHGVEKYTNKKVAVGEAEVTGTNALTAGEAAAEFVRACLTDKAPEPAPAPAAQEAAKEPAKPNGQHNRIPANVK